MLQFAVDGLTDLLETHIESRGNRLALVRTHRVPSNANLFRDVPSEGKLMGNYDGIQNTALRHAAIAVIVIVLIGMMVLAIVSTMNNNDAEAPKNKFPGVSETTIHMGKNN